MKVALFDFFNSFVLILTGFLLGTVIWLYLIPQKIGQHTNIELSSSVHASSLTWITEFRQHEFKVYSQNGEDGVLFWIFTNIGTVNHPPRFVEFGVENGQQCNTRFLREHLGWRGLMMDGSNENIAINLHREIISPSNINDLLGKYETPPLLDLLSIDVE